MVALTIDDKGYRIKIVVVLRALAFWVIPILFALGLRACFVAATKFVGPLQPPRTAIHSAQCEELWAFSVFPPHHLSALTVNMSQTAMNIAAITGPKTNPLIPKVEMPPSVDNSTT
jgi:hypothetical protein